MNPRIVFIAGPLKDSVFSFQGGELSIGRESSNLVRLSDPALSRKHCVLSREGAGFKIRDLDSHNGTFVNGAPAREQWVQHGDRVSIGRSVFIFLLEEGQDEPILPSLGFAPDLPVDHATVKLRAEDVLYLQPEKLLESLPATSRVVQGLNALFNVSQIVHCIHDPKELQAKLLALLFDIVPAEHGAILLTSTTSPEEFSSTCTRDRSAGARPIQISRTVTQQALETGTGILSSHVASTALSSVTSLLDSLVASLLCVPIKLFGKVIGCIYLDTSNLATRFEEDHLQLVTAVAGIAAIAFDNARRLEWLREENERLHTEIELQHNMVGESSAMERVYQFVARVAPTDCTVLLFGESGTGKELVARAIHRNSLRANKPFVAINCAAITEALLESELFGHEKGAFTGATALKKGKLETADSGTIFLDEVGELAPVLQAKLLRALQEREFERVGGTRPVKVDVRLIAATNMDLTSAVKKGAFREDLFYRLNVVSLTIPPLREHREDIPLLAVHFVNHHAAKNKIRPKPISPNAGAFLKNYDWPGNIRELENAIEGALVLGCATEILPEDLPEAVLNKGLSTDVVSSKYHGAVKDLKKRLIIKALQEAGGSYTEAAKILGVHPNYLHRLIRNLNLKVMVKSFPAEPKSA